MKLTPACLVILLAYAITCLKSPVNGRPHPDLSSRSDSEWQSDSDSKSDSSTEDSNGGFDECSSSPCQNGGTCIVATNDYSCTCVDGFLGRNCEEFDECSSSPCQNNGTCIDATNDYNCTCVNGYFGRNCEEFDECSSSPCQNNGLCIDATNDYNCTCVNGYFGRNCEEIEPCLQGWVLNNGNCYFLSQTEKTWQGARSDCLSMNGGHLVDIHSQAELDFLISQIKMRPDYYSKHWLALNDIETEGVFVWADTYEELSFTSWNYNGPPSGDARDCIYFNYKNDMVIYTDVDAWVDDDCSDNHRYICEMEAVYN